MSDRTEFLWYIPNDTKAGHRGDVSDANHNSIDTLTAQAEALERHGWRGALIGTGWGRPDTFTVASVLAARTTTFEPLIAIRPPVYRGQAISMMIASERTLPSDQPVSFRPVIGTLTIRGKLLEAYVQIPANHTARLTTVACTGRLTIGAFSAQPLKRRRAIIQSMRVSTNAEQY